MDKAKEKERDTFIILLQDAVDVSIEFAAPVPDMEEFFNPNIENTLIHGQALVKFSVRADASKKKGGP